MNAPSQSSWRVSLVHRPTFIASALVTLAVVVAASATAGEATTLAIHVIDYAHAPAGTLVQAEHHVTQVYGAIGIKVIWREESVASSETADPHHINVIILSDAMAQRKASTDNIRRNVLGSAAPAPGRRAWIFLSRIEVVASRQGNAAGPILGHVIAHEIAHVIVNMKHSRGGVMDPALPRSDHFEGFTAAQGRQLRLALRGDKTVPQPAPSDVAQTRWPSNPSRDCNLAVDSDLFESEHRSPGCGQ